MQFVALPVAGSGGREVLINPEQVVCILDAGDARTQIVTTGLSIRETIDCMRAVGAEVAAAACIIDRSAGRADVGVPLISLAEYEVPAYAPDQLPPELAGIPAVKPGSRNI